ncbi:CoxG family protein [Nocardioides mangrovi]|uniref:SRPBCC family protein n=1 Tax=Nocardioides mangrovi TaxID=2874580 RepID=A0ABS7UGA6_9ACTN|nr:SRPBCC family protein [Nocardioides mangrovi]MBZ5739835.1 SRPBCC family protein [Nocardioides mangrovi]
MGQFSAETHAVAVITAPRDRIWAVLTDPGLVARMTPFAKRITEDGGHWRWELSGLKVLGVGLAPEFTERMTYDEPSRIEFRHDPPDGVAERAGVEGWYSLDEAEQGTRLETSLRITLDLPLPRASGGAVRKAMGSVVDQMGDRFSANLLCHLDAEQVA